MLTRGRRPEQAIEGWVVEWLGRSRVWFHKRRDSRSTFARIAATPTSRRQINLSTVQVAEPAVFTYAGRIVQAIAGGWFGGGGEQLTAGSCW